MVEVKTVYFAELTNSICGLNIEENESLCCTV
jgi:hypothetical protein